MARRNRIANFLSRTSGGDLPVVGVAGGEGDALPQDNAAVSFGQEDLEQSTVQDKQAIAEDLREPVNDILRVHVPERPAMPIVPPAIQEEEPAQSVALSAINPFVADSEERKADKERIAALEAHCAKLEEELGRYKEYSSEWGKNVKTVKRGYEALERQVVELEDERNRLKIANASLKEECNWAENARLQMEQERDSALEAVESLEDECESLKSAYRSIRQERNELDDQESTEKQNIIQN